MSGQSLTPGEAPSQSLVELLDAESWSQVLELFADTTGLAVALIDATGRMVGGCSNPQPIWSLARATKPEWGDRCPFCLNPDRRCTAAADALRTGRVVYVRDIGGFAHIVAPLFFSDRPVGTLLAGQRFDRYPEQMPLQRVAREFGLSVQTVWQLARQQSPMGSAGLMLRGNMLLTLGQAFLRERFGVILERRLTAFNQSLRESRADLEIANSELHAKVLELAQSNHDKVTLMQEVHHRVNNNLQVIASLLRMQAEASDESHLTDALRVSQNRIESMAAIHAQLYDSGDLGNVDIPAYVQCLATNLFTSYGVDLKRISLRVDVCPLMLNMEQAIPAGLILSELISNALKHAFPDERRGSISIAGGRRDGRVELAVEDDGAGVRDQTAAGRRKSMGLKIVDILIRQLKGTLETTANRAGEAGGVGTGTIFRFSFPERFALASA